jgi:hypothetical protein
MSRGGNYSGGKRAREAERDRKKRDKAERRARRREMGPGEVPIATQDEIAGGLPTIEEAMRAIETRDQEPRGAASVPCRLFIGGLSWDTTSDTLLEAFTQVGPVDDAVVVTDRDTGSSRGFGFVTMSSRKDAIKAIDKYNDYELDGRVIAVRIATDRSD